MKRLTPFDFIEQAKNLHGEKYDYSKIKYVYATEKVTIICKKHNYEFQQRPSEHLKGFGCSICSGKKKKTTDEFIQRAKEIHGEKYTYNKVNYVNSKTKVIITCKIHGDFEQNPHNHLNGYGCDKCGGTYKFTSEEFIQKAKETHGKKYSYEKVNYLNTSTKVIITCPIHGDFAQSPKNHLDGFGCSSCSGKKQKTTDEFIQRAKEVHFNRYNYDKVDYLNSKSIVVINCPEHGDFLQVAESHLAGKGCPKCGGTYKLTKDDFIKRAKEIHGNKYNYENVNYINNRTKVVINCPEHGEFKQAPDSHLSGKGCHKCAGTYKIIFEEFIQKAKEIHGNKYNYDNVNYINYSTKVIINCPEHGDFKQVPANHINAKQGCPKCGGSIKLSNDDFIKRAKEIHGDRYDYSDVIYNNGKTKVEIICSFHGIFKQTPSSHINGKQGCPKCGASRGESKIEGVLKIMNIKYDSQYTFEDCVDKKKLPFDFAIFVNSKIGLIEYQGEQHYKKIDFGKGITNSTFEANQVRDKIKSDYAKKNEIPLLLIAHIEYSKIENLIENFIEKILVGE